MGIDRQAHMRKVRKDSEICLIVGQTGEVL